MWCKKDRGGWSPQSWSASGIVKISDYYSDLCFINFNEECGSPIVWGTAGSRRHIWAWFGMRLNIYGGICPCYLSLSTVCSASSYLCWNEACYKISGCFFASSNIKISSANVVPMPSSSWGFIGSCYPSPEQVLSICVSMMRNNFCSACGVNRSEFKDCLSLIMQSSIRLAESEPSLKQYFSLGQPSSARKMGQGYRPVEH